MCRNVKDGGRRCPSCNSPQAKAKAAANRRNARQARKKLAEYLNSIGMEETSELVKKSPPSLLGDVIQSLDLNAEEILDETKLPSAHNGIDQDKLNAILASAKKEAVTGEQKAALETIAAIPADSSDEEILQAIDKIVAGELTSSEETDAFLSSLKDNPERIEALKQVAVQNSGIDMDSLSAVGGEISTKMGKRDSSVYETAQVIVHGSDTPVEGRRLDGGGVIVRNGAGQFSLYQEVDGVCYFIGSASSKKDAVTRINRLPKVQALTSLPEDASDLEKQVWQMKRDAQLKSMSDALESCTSKEAARKYVKQALADIDVKEKVVDLTVTGPIDVAIDDAVARHAKRVRLLNAEAKGEEARTAALKAGASTIEAQAAYDKAKKQALGTPTRFGGIIPHFGHSPISAEMDKSVYDSMYRSGIRAWGSVTSKDYSVITGSKDDLAKWGFSKSGSNLVNTASGAISLSQQAPLVKAAQPFLDALPPTQRQALTTYTGGSYRAINAAITGRDGEMPSKSTATTVKRLEKAFETLKEKPILDKPIQIARGTRIPSGWKGTADEYFETAFSPGSRVEMGKVSSFTTSPGIASSFSGGGSNGYFIVASTRNGLPVKAISSYSSEDEVILAPGQQMRCVRVEKKGINGMPTVYLVDEEMAAEAQDGVLDSAMAKAA